MCVTDEITTLRSLTEGDRLGAQRARRLTKALDALCREYPDDLSEASARELAAQMKKALASRRGALDSTTREMLRLAYARTLAGLGDRERALRTLIRCRRELRSLKPSSDLYAVACELSGSLLNGVGFHQQAARVMTSCLKQLDLSGVRPGYELLNQIARAHYFTGNYGKALEFFRRAEQALGRGNRERRAWLLNSIGVVLGRMEHHDEAISSHHQSATLAQKLGDSYLAGVNLNNIGTIYMRLEQNSRALKRFKEALEAGRELDEKNLVASVYSNLGILSREMGNMDKALEFSRKGAEIYRALGNTAEVIRNLGNIGGTWNAMEDFDKAREHFQKALTLARKEKLRNLEAIHTYNVADNKMKLNDLNGALSMFKDSLKLSIKLNDWQGVWQSHSMLGKLHNNRGEKKEALDNYRRSIEAIERLRRDQTNDQHKIAYFKSKQDIYRRMAAVAFENGEVETAFIVSEQAKSRTLVDLILEAEDSPRETNVPASLLKKRRELRDRLDALYQEMDTHHGAAATRSGVAELKKELVRLERELEELQAEIRERTASARTSSEAEEITLESVRALWRDGILPQDTRVLSYFVAEPGVLLFVLGAEGIVEALRLPSPAERLEAHLARFYEEIQLLEASERRVELARDSLDNALEPLEELYDVLIRPVEKLLKGCGTLLISPNDFLHRVPFQALYDGESYLVQDYAIGYAPSCDILRYLSGKCSDNAESLVAGAFDGAVPEVEDEARRVGRLFGERLEGRTRSYVGQRATRLSFKRRFAESGIVHFAGHAVFNQRFPTASHLLFAGGERLTVSDIFAGDLGRGCHELVTLSACETGRARTESGDELQGLVRGFIRAGAKAVMVSLWKVHDDSTRDLMIGFYEGWLGKKSGKAGALREAMLDGLNNPDRAHPYFWAPFALLGNSSQEGC